jgi:PAS domain S-box-containing protein
MRVLLVGSAATEGVALAGERARFVVLEAESGQDALGRLAGGGVDCLVCVEGLSDMTAVELLASVRERDESLPVLLVGDDGGLTAAGALAAGVTDYLPAGTGTELLADRIERAVAARRDSQEREREYLTLAGVAPVPMIVVGRDHTVTYANPTAGETIGDGDAEELVGESVLRFVLDGEREATIERIDGVLAEREPVETREYEFLTLDGKRRRARGTIVPVTDEGEPAALIVLDDVTNLRFHERRVEKQRHQIEQLHDIGVELAGCESPDAVYELMVEAADGILDLDLCLVGVVEEERLTLGASSTEMDTDGYIEPPIDSEEAGLSGKAYREERSYHVDDVTEFPDANPVQEYRSFIGVPIGEFGVFQAVAYEEAAFSQTELELVEILAGHVRAALIRLDQQRQLREQRDQLAR